MESPPFHVKSTLAFHLGHKVLFLLPAGFWTTGQNPRRQPRNPLIKRKNIKLADVVWGIDLDLLQLHPPLGMVIVGWLRKGYRVFCCTLDVFAQFMTSRGDCQDSILQRFFASKLSGRELDL